MAMNDAAASRNATASRPPGTAGNAGPSPTRRVLGWVLRLGGIALAALLLYLTISRTDADLSGVLRSASPWPLLIALALLGATHFLGAYRWIALLRVQGVHIGYGLSLKLTIVGHFFCSVVPGAASGDLLKMGYVLKYSQGRGTEAVLSIIIDRILGLAGLIVIGTAASTYMLVRHRALVFAQPLLALTIVIIFAGAVGLAVLYAVLLFRAQLMRWRPCAALTGWAARRLPTAIVAIFSKLATGLDLYRAQPIALLNALGISVVVHFILGVALFCIGRACLEEHMAFIHYLLSTQISNVSALIPLTPGGIGMRDAVTAALFTAFDATPANIVGSIPVINSLLTLCWAAVGAAILTLSPHFRNRQL